MAKSSTAANVIADRYATALIETAEQAKTLDSVEKNIETLAAMLNGSDDLKNLISHLSPGVVAIADALASAPINHVKIIMEM